MCKENEESTCDLDCMMCDYRTPMEYDKNKNPITTCTVSEEKRHVILNGSTPAPEEEPPE